MENKIISIDITPDAQGEINENAGVMWEHNATTLKFNIAPDYVGDYKYYIEYRSLIGTKVRTEYLALDMETNTIIYQIPVTMTCLRGVECYFNIISIDGDGNTVQVVKPRKFCLTFEYSPDTDNAVANDFSINALFEAIRLGTFKGEKGDKGDTGSKGEKGDTGEGVRDLLEVGKNLLDESKLEVGALSSIDGTEDDTKTIFKRTDYIYLEAGSYVYSNSVNSYVNFRLCVYDLNKVFERTQNGNGKNSFTIDSAKYIRLHDSDNRKNQQLEFGTEPTAYEPYTEKVKLEYIPIKELNIPVAEDDFNAESENSLKNKVITKRFNGFLGVGKNLYNNAKRINDVAVSNASTQKIGAEAKIITSTGHATSEWIEVEENTQYVLSNSYSSNVSYRVQIVDENNILVKDYFTQGRKSAFEIPAGGKKIRFSNSQAIMDTTQFEKGEKSTEYEEYKEVVKPYNLPSVVQRNWFEGKTILFNGDSITAGTGLTPVTQAYPYLACKELNAKIINNAIGGSALASKPDSETRSPLILRYDTEVTDDVAETVDLVYIAIGTNDWAYQYTPVGTMEDRVTTTFYGALHLLCQGLLKRYSGKPIVFATPIKRRVQEAHTSPTEYLRNGKTLKEYGEIIKEVCDFYSIPVIDMYSECCLTPFIDEQRNLYFQETSGGIHPNAGGAKIMARRVVAGLRSIVGF